MFHVGDCGAHTKAKIRCTASRQVGAIQKIQTLVRNTKSFFGQDLKLVNELSQVPRRTPGKSEEWRFVEVVLQGDREAFQRKTAGKLLVSQL